MDLVAVLYYLFPHAVAGRDFALENFSGTLQIVAWNTALLGAQPTQAQLDTAWATVQLTQAKSAQRAVIEQAYFAARYGPPVTVTFGSTAYTFPTDVDTQQNIMGYIAANVTNATGTQTYSLMDASGTVQQLTYAQLELLGQAIQNVSTAAFTKKLTLEGEIAAATTVSGVQSIVW